MSEGVAALQRLKRDGRKLVCVVAWDEGTARTLDAAGVDLISVGDSGAASLEELMTGQVAEVPGASHYVHDDNLPGFAAELQAFLGSPALARWASGSAP